MDIPSTVYYATTRKRLRVNPVVSLASPCQARNTTPARMLAEHTADALHFFDLEWPADLARLAKPELVLDGLRGLVILDEVQRRSYLFPLLLVCANRPGTPARILVLCSASQDLAILQLYVVYPGEYEFALDESLTAMPLPRLVDAVRSEAAHA